MIDFKLFKSVLKGLLTFIPGVGYIKNGFYKRSLHSSSNAEFCYTLWLTILIYFKENGLTFNLKKVGELGTGGSLGVGMCAIFTGVSEFYALEIEDNFSSKRNVQLLNEIVVLFKNKTPLRNNFKQINIKINSYEFPNDLVDDKYLNPTAIADITSDLQKGATEAKRLKIVFNWNKTYLPELEFIFSRAVMEHVKFPQTIYKSLKNALKPDSFMLHDIEFHSHGITNSQHGHLKLSHLLWTLISGNRTYYLNRDTIDDHVNYLTNSGFEILDTQITEVEESGNFIIIGACLLIKLT